MGYTVLFDEPQEAAWFKNLNPDLIGAKEIPISEAADIDAVKGVLGYDRPDIVLLKDGQPILVVEETVEVPSGHNVGQRFARLAAAAEHQVPCLYFGPYKARKHGGITEGPRYMNLRLFGALDAMTRVNGTAMTTINWPVDADCEVRRDKGKDADVREYVEALLSFASKVRLPRLNQEMLSSKIHSRMLQERADFITSIKKPEQYNSPPNSVEILKNQTLISSHRVDPISAGIDTPEIVLYKIGMRAMRADPYTGMAMLYHYLYIAEHSHRSLILWFPHISHEMWCTAAKNPKRKDIRLYKHSAEGILFSDKLVAKANL